MQGCKGRNELGVLCPKPSALSQGMILQDEEVGPDHAAPLPWGGGHPKSWEAEEILTFYSTGKREDFSRRLFPVKAQYNSKVRGSGPKSSWQWAFS